jgi:hypothetical protein
VVPIRNSSLLTIILYSSVTTTLVYNDTKYSVPFMTLYPSSSNPETKYSVSCASRSPEGRRIYVLKQGYKKLPSRNNGFFQECAPRPPPPSRCNGLFQRKWVDVFTKAGESSACAVNTHFNLFIVLSYFGIFKRLKITVYNLQYWVAFHVGHCV